MGTIVVPRRYGSPVSRFMPEYLSGVKHLWRINSKVTLSGSKITNVPHIIGGVSLIQPTDAKRLVYRPNRWCGTDTAYSSGTQGMYTASAITLTRPFTVIMFGTFSYDAMSYEYGVTAATNASGGSWQNGAGGVGIANCGSSSSTHWSVCSYPKGSPHTVSSTSVIVDGCTGVYAHEVADSAAGHRLMVNGRAWPIAAGFTGSPGPGTRTTTAVFNVGCRDAAGTLGFGSVGEWSEIVILDHVPTAKEYQYIMQYADEQLHMPLPWSVLFSGDSIMGSNGPSPYKIRRLVYPNDKTNSYVYDISVAGETIATQTNRINGSGVYGTLRGVSSAKVAVLQASVNTLNTNGGNASAALSDMQAQINAVRADNSNIQVLVVACSPCSLINNGVRTTYNNGLASLTGVTDVVTSHLATLDNGSGALKTIYMLNGTDVTHMSPDGQIVLASAIQSKLFQYGHKFSPRKYA